MTLATPTQTRVRALFVDMDGTLIGPDERVTPVVRAAIQAAYAQGVAVIPCTGRTRYTAQPIAEQLGIPLGYAVTANGAIVSHLGTDEVLHCNLMPRDMALEIIRAIYALGAQPYVYEASTSMDVELSRALYHPALPIGPWATPPRYRAHPEILESLPFDPVSVATFGPKAQIHPLTPTVEARLGDRLSILQSGSEHYWGIETYAAGVHKHVGAEALITLLGITQAETMAIGDHLNDLTLLRWAGVGVAMHNGQPEAIAAADYVTASVYEDGVAHAIERFILSV